MTDIKLFENPEFGQVRVLLENGEPLFCLADICNILELRVTDVKNRLEDEVVSIYPITDSLGRQQDTNFVNEEGFYSVVLGSRKESVKPFKKWVTSEVLPSIRKTGSYSVRTLSPAELIIAQGQAMLALEQKQREHELRLNATESKVNELVSIQEENLKHLNKLPLAEEEIIQITPRQELNQMVRTYAQSAGIKYNEVWSKIYSELYYRYHISINAYKKEKGENNLDVAEKIGAIEKLKVIVSNLIKEIGKVRPLVKK